MRSLTIALLFCFGLFATTLASDVQSLECDLCKAFLKSVEDLLDGGHTEKEVIDEMEKLCEDTLGNKLVCETFVNTFGKQIIDSLLNDLSPESLCKDFGLCRRL